MVDYEKAFNAVLTALSGPGEIRALYEWTKDENLKEAMRKWWKPRYRKPL